MRRRIVFSPWVLLTFALASCVEDQITAPRIQSGTLLPRTTITTTAVSEKIAFVRQDATTADIWVMNPDGTGKTNISNTSTPGADEVSPSWSPDGTRIVFNRGEEIYVMNADGTGETQLTNNTVPDYMPSWSPTGNKIAFVSDRATGNQEIYVMNADGTNQTRLTTKAGDDRRPAWSPDGSKIAFYNIDDYDIYTMNADGTAVTNLTNSASQEQDPAWSPDGSKIAFARHTGTKYEIFVMSPNGTGQTSLTAAANSSAAPAWSPDGTRIAFERNSSELYVMNADGTSEINVGNTPAGESSYWPSWWGPVDADSDNDGIYDLVDTNPTTVSVGFSDIPLGGGTAGTIESVPANTAVTIHEATAPYGVLVTTVATGTVAPNARVTIRLTGKTGLEKLAVPGTYVITDPATSTTVAVETGGPAEVELTLNGSPIVVSISEGASATVNETTDGSGALTDVTVSDVTGESGDVTVNGAPVEPGSPPVAPAALNAKLTVNRGKLTLTGTFTPAGTAAVNPGVSDVTIEAGAYSFVKTGGLTRNKSGAYAFSGTLPSAPGVQFTLELKPPKTGKSWTVKATADPVSGFVNPVRVSLQIGDVAGGAQVTATLR